MTETVIVTPLMYGFASMYYPTGFLCLRSIDGTIILIFDRVQNYHRNMGILFAIDRNRKGVNYG